ncbi:hypothetical protein [Streptomyces sp. NPDC060333]|uniref:hypothetical protein n=1 Tax=Streptomyces sp. NPDC060333 TaxID=3347098 RepID=UPI00365A7EF7
MSDESVITIEIRGHEKAVLEAAHRISHLFLSIGPAGCGAPRARARDPQFRIRDPRRTALPKSRVAEGDLTPRLSQNRA